MAHITGQSRYQATLYPEVLDEVIAPDSTVRVIDAFVDSLDLGGWDFRRSSRKQPVGRLMTHAIY
jgi:hypothetical protein